MKKTIIISLIIITIIAGAFWVRSREKNNKAFNEKITLKTKKNINKNIMKKEDNNGKLKIEILKKGKGVEEIQNGDIITVNYVGYLENGKKFDSSYDRGTPFKFKVGAGEVIKGWEEGLLGMKIGEKRKLIIPPNLAYGERSIPGMIPPNSTLIFEVELLNINRPVQ